MVDAKQVLVRSHVLFFLGSGGCSLETFDAVDRLRRKRAIEYLRRETGRVSGSWRGEKQLVALGWGRVEEGTRTFTALECSRLKIESAVSSSSRR